jgi:hypothetical protein
MPSILHLQITKKDFLSPEDLIEKRMNESINIPSGEPSICKVNHTPLPKCFTGLKTWPKTSNFRCNTCIRRFKSIPLFMPKSIISNGENVVINYEGVFCGFCCIMTYINRTYPINTYEHIHSKFKKLTCVLYKLIYSKRVNNISPAPYFTELIEFGGTMDKKKYYETIDELNNHIYTNTAVSLADGLPEFNEINKPSITSMLYEKLESDLEDDENDDFKNILSEWD